MITGSEKHRLRWAKILAPVIDSALLISAITLAIKTQQYPIEQNWLTAKIIAMIIYIILGMVALNYGRTKNIRTTAWIGALFCFSYIVSVAISRNPVIL